MRFSLIVLFIFSLHIGVAQDFGIDWNGFSQRIPVSQYKGLNFRFKGYVKTTSSSPISRAYLWARIDKKKGMGFFDNMIDRPIVKTEWEQYTITGNIDKKAEYLYFGVFCFGNARYYFDDFTIEIKAKEGDWREIQIPNPGFEEELSESNWRQLFKTNGFNLSRTLNQPHRGSYSMKIDATSRSGKEKFIISNGITIHYQEHGRGDTLLLLHGNSMSLESFSKQIPELSKEFFVIAMDSRGQGYTTHDGKAITYELMAEDVHEFLINLNAKKVHVLGWSDGGNIGLILAMRYPEQVRSLATMGANLFNDPNSVKSLVNKELISQKKKLLKEDNAKNSFRLQMIELLLNEPKIDPNQISVIQCPTLIMAGSNDAITDEHTRLISSKIKNSELLIFEKGTHFVPTENPERFNKAVMNFFRSN